MKRRTRLCVLALLALLLSLLLSLPAIAIDAPDVDSAGGLAQSLSGKTVGVMTGSVFDQIAQELLPDAQRVHFAGYADMMTAIAAGKIDAFLADEPSARLLDAQMPQTVYVSKALLRAESYGFAVAKGNTALCEQINTVIGEMAETGALTQLTRKWFAQDASVKTLPDVTLSGENGALRVAVDPTVPPFTYVSGGEVVGYDIEILLRVAEKYGYTLDISTMNFGSLLPEITSGKSDVACGCMAMTQERAAQVLFSEPDYHGGVVAVLPYALKPEPSRLDAYNQSSVRIGVSVGAMSMAAAEKRFPQAQFVYVTSSADGYMAVRQGRIDAYAFDSVNATCACRELGGMEILPESFGRTEIAVGISKLRPDLAAPVNEALSRLRAAGTLEDLYRRWITIGDHAMPEIAAPEHPQITLRVGTSGLTEPMSFVGESGALIGYDVELTRLLAREMNAKIELKSMGFDALVSGLQSGKLDLVLSNLNITPERREIIDYSDPYLLSDSVLVIANGDGAYDLPFLRSYFGAGSRVGIGTGSVFDQIADEAFPQAQKVYFSTSTDMIEGMKTGKIDGFLTDRPQGACACAENDFLWMPEAVIKEDRYAFAVNKKQPALCDQISRTIERLQREGALTALAEKWMGADEAQKPMPEIAFTGENGPMTLMTEAGSYPFSYVRDGEIVGYDIEIFLRFCEEFGYTPDIETAAFDGVITAIATGKADLAACCISVTDERKENMLFSTPNFYGGVAAILPASAKASGDAVVPAQAQAETPSFFADVAASFERTFLRENRWKMIASGLWVTVLISVLSCLFGTLLGFVVCLARRSKYRALAVVARVYIRLVQGTPLVVLLMILYYLVFGDVEPILVAVVGFSVNFAAYVSEMMRTGIDAVDKGQIEAAAAIGFTRVQTFLRITLPQAARHFLPVFKGEFISLVKMTSVVGYITIEDLTKVSDIIRSRTYEAFFPLIATAVLYFLIAWVLTLALSAIEKGIDPKRKKRAVKGVHAV